MDGPEIQELPDCLENDSNGSGAHSAQDLPAQQSHKEIGRMEDA